MLLVQNSPPPPPPPSLAQGTPVAAAPQGLPYQALQTRDAQLTSRIRDLRSQRNILLEQLRSRDQGMMTAASTELGTVDAKIKTLGDEQVMVRAQMAVVGPPPPPRPGEAGYVQPQRPRSGPSEEVAIIGVVFTLAVLMPIAIGFARRLWRRAATPPAPADTIGPRMDRLEQAVDAVAIEIERISEGQRFVTKVMMERPAQARTNVRSATPDSGQPQQQAVGEAPPFLALGAGPVEPIRVAERQKVKPSITPH